MRRYRAFSAKRDGALESLLVKARAKISDDLRQFMVQVQTEVARAYPLLNKEHLDPRTANEMHAMDKSIDRHAYAIALSMAQHWTVLRYVTLALTNASEQQALINSRGGAPKPVDLVHATGEAYEPTDFGGVSDRCYLALSRFRRKVVDAVEVSRMMGDDIRDAMDRVMRAFPQAEIVKRPRALKRIKESDAKKGEKAMRFADFFASPREWEDIVDAYKQEYLPRWRDPRTPALNAAVSVGERDTFAVYPWQLESEVTDDFVAMVARGQVAGAKKQGITDFVWIAVVDDRTDDCCLKRDGLTTEEIRAKLKGEWQKDECRAVVPLAHPNCRCRLAPATDEMPEVPDSGQADFEDWLNS